MSSGPSLLDGVRRCRFRKLVEGSGGNETACCSLLARVAQVRDERLCQVGQDACEVCCSGEEPSPENINPVIASLLYNLMREVIDRGGVPGCSAAQATDLKRWAEWSLPHVDGSLHPIRQTIRYAVPEEYQHRGRTYSCDVVLCCGDASPRTEAAVRSVLRQQNAAVLLHLVDDGGGGREMLERFGGRWNVLPHRNPQRKGLWDTLHDLVGRFRTPYVAVQDPRTISRPDRICYSVGLLEDNGGELLGAGFETPAGHSRPIEPHSTYGLFLPEATIVLRRASFVDMGGTAERDDAGAELVYRAYCERRAILLAPEVTVTSPLRCPPGTLGPSPVYQPRDGVLRHHARGFPHRPVECDVVLPFCGHLDYVGESMEGLLAQRQAGLVIHLIDDASPENTDALLRYWGTHAQVRTYRNARNIGQYASFNNVVRYLETSLVAVQDADDVSLPDRMHVAGNILRLADAAIFGSGIRSFTETSTAAATGAASSEGTIRRLHRHAVSRYPRPGVGWFLFNPTMVVRADSFAALGGFADFGDVLSNRCSLDSEFCNRAYYAGARFALSRQPTVLYRKHPDQATRNSLTGFGTGPRESADQDCRRRRRIYEWTRFDPGVFGALGRDSHLTRRLGPRQASLLFASE
jgi:glycosyltransferase involved in cell wall biosynthesis